MCGIACIINKKGNQIKRSEIQKMNNVMQHRGPDAEGIYINGNVGFGHRRLSIVGLTESGNQPMISYDNRLVVIFNGEIYNYVELKDQLRGEGAKFITDTDTEVILEAYRYWGEGCTEHFNGMWTIILYDIQYRRLFISRDRFGIKPLYFYDSEDELIFASEIKCITAIRPEQKIVDITQVARYLAGIQEDMDEHTFYRDIHNFPPSFNMLYDLVANKEVYEQYWRINVSEFTEKWRSRNWYKKFLELLKDAIKIRLRADVKVGASLSGGLDSSTIVGIISKEFAKKMHTFSSIYKEKNCDEKEYIDCMNKYANTISHYIYPDNSENIIQDMKDLIYYHDGPCRSASPYSGYCVYRGVGNHVKVLLDGQGADELFGGYLFFYNAKLKELLKKNTWTSQIRAISLLYSFCNTWPEKIDILDDELVLKTLGVKGYKNYKKKAKKGDVSKNQGMKMKYLGKFADIDLKFNFYDNDSITNELDKALNYRLQYQMLPRILHDVDRNSMANSLEVRLPFLDYRLVEFSYVLPDQYKIRGCWTKYIIRRSCRKYLPEKVSKRRNKMGFPAPFDKWLRDERFKYDIEKYINAFKERNIIDNDSLELHYRNHILEKENCAEQLFRIMSLEIWLQNEIDAPGRKWRYEESG